jgi:hypothetical protein
MLTLRIPIGMGLAQATARIHRSAVKEVVKRTESDPEAIARLEGELATLKGDYERLRDHVAKVGIPLVPPVGWL